MRDSIPSSLLAAVLVPALASTGCAGSAQRYDDAAYSGEATGGAPQGDPWQRLEADEARRAPAADTGSYRGQPMAPREPQPAPRAGDTATAERSEPSVARKVLQVFTPSPKSRPAPAPRQTKSYAQPAPTSPQAGKAVPQAEPKQPEQSLVVYMGYLKLRVKRQLDAVDAVTRLAKTTGGYVQSLTQQVVVVRVPATDFEGAMARFAAVGEVVDRRVKALDVSRQYTDVHARLQVAVEARGRLLALLKSVKDVDERLQILEEIKRLTEHIETAESTLATLRNLASYFTITIELEPLVQHYAGGSAWRSPFDWVRRLQAHRVTVEDGRDRIGLEMPRGFVLFEEDDVFRAQAADTAMLRAGTVANEPRGDSAFWSQAVHHELDARDEELVEEGVHGQLHARVYRNKDLQPRYYLVAVHAEGEDLFVVEVFFPNEAAWQAHGAAVRKALATFQVL